MSLYSAPFRNVMMESDSAKIARIVSIGAADLLAWWNKVKDLKSPGTYGDTGCSFASAVAYMLANGGPSDFQKDNQDIYYVQIKAFNLLKGAKQ